MNLDKICYTNTPIKKVILRVDFLVKVSELNESLPSEITDVIKNSFPIAEARNVIAKEFQISNVEITQNNKNIQEWSFHTAERNASLIIKEDSFSIDINNYISFNDILKVFTEIKNVFFTNYPNLISKRIGLRYINEIIINEENQNPLDWTKHINSNLISIFKSTNEPSKIIRAFHNLELNYDDIMLKFQYGVHNSDYPAIIKKKVFILDLDAFYNGILKKDEIDKFVERQHKIIQEQFEFSITDNLREYYKSL